MLYLSKKNEFHFILMINCKVKIKALKVCDSLEWKFQCFISFLFCIWGPSWKLLSLFNLLPPFPTSGHFFVLFRFTFRIRILCWFQPFLTVCALFCAANHPYPWFQFPGFANIFCSSFIKAPTNKMLKHIRKE